MCRAACSVWHSREAFPASCLPAWAASAADTIANGGMCCACKDTRKTRQTTTTTTTGIICREHQQQQTHTHSSTNTSPLLWNINKSIDWGLYEIRDREQRTIRPSYTSIDNVFISFLAPALPQCVFACLSNFVTYSLYGTFRIYSIENWWWCWWKGGTSDVFMF